MASQNHTGKYLLQVLIQISPSREATLTTPIKTAAHCLTTRPFTLPAFVSITFSLSIILFIVFIYVCRLLYPLAKVQAP